LSAVELDKSFDRIASLYEQARPTYPDSVFERILDFAALGSSARVLEVGVGTGKATLPLAQRGLHILGLEPGPSLAHIARAQLAGFANVEVQTVSFEEWEAPAGGFDLAFVAQAFHWLAPSARLPKFARALRPSGALAVFGNAAALAAGSLRDSVQEVYGQHAAALYGYDQASNVYSTAAVSPIFLELQSSALFTDVHTEITTWERAFSSRSYCDLLATYSDHSTLPESQLRDLLAGVARVIDEHGGTASVTYTTGLFLARTV
jgi:SAM-dependent methyltransferase